MTDSFQEHVKLTARVNTTFTHVSGQGAIVPTTNVRYLQNGLEISLLILTSDEITSKIRKPVPEDSLVSQENDEIETGETEARVSFDKDAELLSNSSPDQLIFDEREWQRSVKSVERIDSVG